MRLSQFCKNELQAQYSFPYQAQYIAKCLRKTYPETSANDEKGRPKRIRNPFRTFSTFLQRSLYLNSIVGRVREKEKVGVRVGWERERETERETETERRIGLKRFMFIRLIIYYLLDHSHSPLSDWLVKTS